MNTRNITLIPAVMFALSLFMCSCEAPQSHKTRDSAGKTNSAAVERNMTPLIYRGMFSIVGEQILQDCNTGKKLLVSDKSDLSSIENALAKTSSDNNKKKIYIEAEGFVSTEENTSRKQVDTVLVIGRVSRIDLQFDCSPQ